MRKGNTGIILATAAILVIAASTIPAIAKPDISFDGDQVNFFADEGTWHVTINGTEYSGEIQETNGKDPWKVVFGCRSPGFLKNSGVFFDTIGVGEYSASAWINDDEAVTGTIVVTNSECNTPPVPELSPIILVTAGLIGIVAVSRKFKKN